MGITEHRFEEIAPADAVLSDPARRADDDARGRAGVSGCSAEDLFGGIDFEDLFSVPDQASASAAGSSSDSSAPGIAGRSAARTCAST